MCKTVHTGKHTVIFSPAVEKYSLDSHIAIKQDVLNSNLSCELQYWGIMDRVMYQESQK